MNTTTFLRGVCVGMVAGAAVDMIVNPRPKVPKTAVGKAMRRMGNAVDAAVDTVTCMAK
jgi:gas vesicle protein